MFCLGRSGTLPSRPSSFRAGVRRAGPARQVEIAVMRCGSRRKQGADGAYATADDGPPRSLRSLPPEGGAQCPSGGRAGTERTHDCQRTSVPPRSIREDCTEPRTEVKLLPSVVQDIGTPWSTVPQAGGGS